MPYKSNETGSAPVSIIIMKKLFWTFCKIGAFTLGGGYAMVPLLEREVVDKNQWLDKESFMDILVTVLASKNPTVISILMMIKDIELAW